jgi:hypothetical protein
MVEKELKTFFRSRGTNRLLSIIMDVSYTNRIQNILYSRCGCDHAFTLYAHALATTGYR